MPARGIITIDNIVVISKALVIGLGFTPYWVEKINAIKPTGAEATIIVVSETEKSILLRFHIKIIASIGWRITLKITIK